MATIFDKISGNDEIFNHKEYIADSLIYNTIEAGRRETYFNLYSDHKNVIKKKKKKGNRVWLWTSSTIKEDTNKLIDICRFIRDCGIPKAEIYLKEEVAGNFSDLYALTTLEINYVVKDELSLAVYTYNGGKITDADGSKPAEDEKIILIDKENTDHVKLVTEFYRQLCDEFHWNNKFDRKVSEYLDMEQYALIKDGKMIANVVIGSNTDKYSRIKSIAVLADRRRQGFGYKMCVYAVNQIKNRELTPVLYAHVGNASAVALWNKTGFKAKNKLNLLKIENND